jgi:hypothetical protein
MKNAPHDGAGRGAESKVSGAVPPVPFLIIGLEQVEYGSKRATATIEIVGLGTIDVDYFRPPGRAAFVAGKSVRSKYGGQFERTAAFEPEFASELLIAIESRLAADADGAP